MTCNEWNFMTFYCKKQHLNYDNKNMKTSILNALLLTDFRIIMFLVNIFTKSFE